MGSYDGRLRMCIFLIEVERSDRDSPFFITTDGKEERLV